MTTKFTTAQKSEDSPDLIKNVVKKDFTIIDATLDKSAKNQGLYEFLKEAVAPFGITDEKRIKKLQKKAGK